MKKLDGFGARDHSMSSKPSAGSCFTISSKGEIIFAQSGENRVVPNLEERGSVSRSNR